MDDPLFSPDEIPVDETIDYLQSLRQRTIAFVLPIPAEPTDEAATMAATGTDDGRAGL